jgi:hypothetical protein
MTVSLKIYLICKAKPFVSTVFQLLIIIVYVMYACKVVHWLDTIRWASIGFTDIVVFRFKYSWYFCCLLYKLSKYSSKYYYNTFSLARMTVRRAIVMTPVSAASHTSRKKFNLGYIFWTIGDRILIFHI